MLCVAVTQPKHYYIFLKTGTWAGMYYSVVANEADSLTVDTARDHLSTAIDSTTALDVIVYDTLGPIFLRANPGLSHFIAVAKQKY